MKKLLRRPYNWYLLSIPLLYSICVSASTEDSIDIQLHDTMLVISKYHFYILPTLILFAWAALHALVYKVRRQWPNKIITSIHLAIAFIGPLFLVMPKPTQPETQTWANFESVSKPPFYMMWLGIVEIYVVAQLLFLVYLFIFLSQGIVLRVKGKL